MRHPMLEAREFFRSLGVRINEQGLVESDLTEEELVTIKKWFENTKENGIQMPHEEDFYRNILLCISLAPQEKDGQIQYLLGKGIGTEIALRGNAKGREKLRNDFPYRSHSDFEIYASRNGSLGGNFKKLFGGQEFFPEDHTKGLANIPKGLMYDTAEKVEIDGYTFFLPQLELLFLDKFLVQEATPREQGCDAKLLAMAYELDSGLTHKYLEEYSVEPSQAKLENNRQTSLADTRSAILRRIKYKQSEMQAESEKEIKIKDVLTALNKEIGNVAIKPNTSFSGILKGVYVDVNTRDIQKDLDGEIVLKAGYLESLDKKHETYFKMKEQEIISRHKAVDELLETKKVFSKEEIAEIHVQVKDEILAEKAMVQAMEEDRRKENAIKDR